MKQLLLLSLPCLLMVGCVRDMERGIDTSTESCGKIINSPTNAIAGEIMVKAVEGVEELSFDNVSTVECSCEPIFARGNNNRESLAESGLDRWYMVRFDENCDLESMARTIAADSRVAYVEYNKALERRNEPELVEPSMDIEATTRALDDMPYNDPQLPYQWNLMNDGFVGELSVIGADVNVFDAWKYTTGDSRIIVAVVDNGIRVNHPDLDGNMWVNEIELNGVEGVDDDENGYIDDINGYNFCDDKGEITWKDHYDTAHATHVAGIIAAETNNGRGVAGIAGGSGNNDGVRIMSCQVFSSYNVATSAGFANAFIYAADNGASVINNSWGYEAKDVASDSAYLEKYSVLQDAINYFEQYGGNRDVIDGGIVVFAGGNDGKPLAMYPAAYKNVIGVAAFAPDFKAANYTNYGPGINVCAPGGDTFYGEQYNVLSTTLSGRGFGYMQGTSMACPHVSGVAALGLSYAIQKGYKLSARDYRNLIITSTQDIDKYQTGYANIYDKENKEFDYVDMSRYAGALGTGYVDAHLLLMQLDQIPCLYTSAGSNEPLALDNLFSDAAHRLNFTECVVSQQCADDLGISEAPSFKDGKLCIECSKPGTGRIIIKAVIGAGSVTEGMEIEREVELVVRRSKAENGGWL